MSHYVPDFNIDEDYSLPTNSAALTPPKKSSMPDDEIMELLWHNGQVVMQSQNQRSFKKLPPSRFQDPGPAPKEIRPADHLFMQEDEMVSWLQYDPPFEHDFCADLLYPSSSSVTISAPTTTTPSAAPTVRPGNLTEQKTPLTTSAIATASRPPVPPIRTAVLHETPRIHNFPHFGRHKHLLQQSAPSNSKSVVRESTVVDSSDTPPLPLESKVSLAKASCSEAASGWNHQNACETMTAAGHGMSSREIPAITCDVTVSSSPGGSSGSAELATQMPAEDRKRKGRESEETDCASEDVDFESGGGGKKQSRGSSAKRSRAAEVHNLSERRRRDRINEKMKALQELIPRCNKSDKASMLDEAIEYLKSLQMQVQMMSMGCGMVPMMFPGIQQYMPSMGMGLGMSMGLDIAGMSRPMMPFPNVMAGPSLPTSAAAAAAAHLAPRYPVQAFAMQPPVPGADPSRIQPNPQQDVMFNAFGMQAAAANLPRGPPFPDPYQQYIGLQPMHLQPPQNQAQAQAGPSTSRTAENIANRPSDADKL